MLWSKTWNGFVLKDGARSKRIAYLERPRIVDPYYISGAQLFVNRDQADEIRGIEDLGGRTVGVTLGETYEHYLRNKHPEVRTVTYKRAVDIFQDMKNGRLDGFVTDRLVGLYQIKSADMPFEPVGELLYGENMALPVLKENTALLRSINKALAKMKKSGELSGLHEK